MPIPTNACTSPPKVGAQCGSSARWDLRGGLPERAVPTATQASPSCSRAEAEVISSCLPAKTQRRSPYTWSRIRGEAHVQRPGVRFGAGRLSARRMARATRDLVGPFEEENPVIFVARSKPDLLPVLPVIVHSS